VGAGSPNADLVAEVLRKNGLDAEWTDRVKEPNPFLVRRFDIIYGIYLQSCARFILVGKLLRKKTIIHFVGSDAYWYNRERSLVRRFFWRAVLHLNDVVFYVSPHLEKIVGRPGKTLPFPIQKNQFLEPSNSQPDRDILYYCPSEKQNLRIYRLDWILQYAKDHPQEKITIIGSSNHPANYPVALHNVEVIPQIPRSDMPALYRRHRTLIRMTTEDGLPRMVHEALLCGLKVIFNGEEITVIPNERDPTEFARSFRTAMGLT
jgi:hypothetical protein